MSSVCVAEVEADAGSDPLRLLFGDGVSMRGAGGAFLFAEEGARFLRVVEKPGAFGPKADGPDE